MGLEEKDVMSIRDEKLVIAPHRPGLKEKLFFLISGIIVSVPLTFFIQSFAQYLGVISPVFLSTSFTAIVLAPLVEEFAKVYPLVYRHGETERSIYTLGFLVGLGFGLSEFILYIIVLEAPIAMRLYGIFFHAASTSITVYGIATNRPIEFYLIAVALHFSNNLFATTQFRFIASPVIVLITFFLAWDLYQKTSERFVKT